jgi:hypothetical protein
MKVICVLVVLILVLLAFLGIIDWIVVLGLSIVAAFFFVIELWEERWKGSTTLYSRCLNRFFATNGQSA